MGHRKKECHCGEGGCWTCELFVCDTCGLFEGSLTTECPGVESYAAKGDDVYAGRIDFRDGQWVPGNGDMPCHSRTIQIER